MTVQELIDNQARQADDTSASYATAALRWLNLVRSFIADKARWQHAVRVDHFSTNAAVSDGLYTLDGYEHLEQEWMFNETSQDRIVHESHATLDAVDTNKAVTGPPTHWGDAGADAKGDRRIYLWTIPDSTYKIRFKGYRRFIALTTDDLTKTLDPFFGSIDPWSWTFSRGMQLLHREDDNESANQTLLSDRSFSKALKTRMGTNKMAPVNSVEMARIRSPYGAQPGSGRFNPANYNNR